ncbi:DUF2752 domain-containing protein [Streptomyces sp. SID3343]|uniref:DUF2752 domain-containing protein n=1 Tax=Streptomyces sp. SID3343 TaxID=2690260 RepID=UPI0013697446|nr:DUF2752 domain-containing protein [Streptomyces sp. SID3343]
MTTPSAHPTPTPGFRLRNLGLPAATLALVTAATTYVGLVDPRESGHYPPCPYLWLTGLACPGCGGLRCVHALTRLDVPAALGYNALAVLMFPVIGWLWLRWTLRTARGEPRRSLSDPRWLWGLLVVVLLFWVVRDLPFGAALAP